MQSHRSDFLRILIVSAVILATGCVARNSQPSTAAGLNIYSGFDSMVTPAGTRRPWPHRGVDIAAAVGAPIIAPADGIVMASVSEERYGIKLELVHEVAGERFHTVYGHLDRTLMKVGDPVRRGQVVGHIGTTGATSFQYSHVHFEITLHGIAPQDPEKIVIGCFDPNRAYPSDRVVLTWPLRC